MKKVLLRLGILSIVLMVSMGAASPKNPLDITQNLPIKDDRGKPWVLKNSSEYKMKWSMTDPSPFQNYELYEGPKGLMYIKSFDDLMLVNPLTGSIVWKKPLKTGSELQSTIGSDHTYYRVSSTEGKLLSKDVYRTNVTRYDVTGTMRTLSSIEMRIVPWSEDSSGFSIIDAGDSQGNYLVISDKGLLSIKPDGTTNWLIGTIPTKDGSLDTTKAQSILTDNEGNIYLKIDETLVSLSVNGTVNWARNYQLKNSNTFYYADGAGILGEYTYSDDFSLQHTKLYKMTDQGLVQITDPAVINQRMTNSDRHGGVYTVNDKNNILTNENYSTGKPKWTYQLGKFERNSGMSLFSGSLDSDNKGNVYFGTNAGAVYSLDFTGKPRFVLWMYNNDLSYPEIYAVNENLVVMSINNHVICIEKKTKK
ncbi:PQQ-binding-like beta-propeller repeat protein [Paenibacillus zeisoli]|nr:PQQ-binding-like beta-propeller repeat protein [Paenibacillus zeisoli]